METTPGKRVQMIREAKGYKSITAFAEFTGLKIGTLSALEGDKSSPSMETLARLHAAFPDISMEWLISGTGTMLRDARTLTPRAAAEPLPPQQPDYTSGPGTVNTVVETLLRERLADKDALIELLRAENLELRGKPFDSSDAADSPEAPIEPTDPRFAGGAMPLPMIRKRAGFKPSFVEAAELSE